MKCPKLPSHPSSGGILRETHCCVHGEMGRCIVLAIQWSGSNPVVLLIRLNVNWLITNVEQRELRTRTRRARLEVAEDVTVTGRVRAFGKVVGLDAEQDATDG